MRPVSLICAVLAATALSACAGDAPTPTPTPPTPTPATPLPSPPASPSASPSATASAAPVIEGLEVLAEDPSHEHRDGRIAYDRVPPLGGPHNARWLACDVYDEQVPDEVAVHSIEHGAVWITHAPDLPQAERALLTALAATDPEYVLVSPRTGLDSRIVAVTWGAAIEATTADDRRLAQFARTYAGGAQGGEPGAPCRTGGVTLAQARQLVGG